MATVVPIDDPADERVADYVGLTDGELRRRGDVFLCEGALVVRRAIDTGTRLRSVLLIAKRLPVLADELAAVDVPVYLASSEVMNAVTGFDIHRGIIAAATRPSPPPLDALLGARTLAVLEGVNDHENLGSLFRNAAAFGVGGVLLDPTTADPLYRRSVRVSLGHVLAVPHRRMVDLAELESVRAAGFTVVALTPDRSADAVETIAGLPKVAFLLGAEGPGLSAAALSAADRHVRIPMVPGVDSLNVATAAAIAFHHRFS